MHEFIKYVGLDTHKETVAVAIADRSGGRPRYYGEIVNTPMALAKLMKDISPHGEVVSYCYEAGPCGYGIYRQNLILDMISVAPRTLSLICLKCLLRGKTCKNNAID